MTATVPLRSARPDPVRPLRIAPELARGEPDAKTDVIVRETDDVSRSTPPSVYRVTTAAERRSLGDVVSRSKGVPVQARTATAVVLIWLSFAPAALAATSTPETLSVEGQGSVMITPDQASLSVSVTRSALTSAPALSAANRTADAIVHAVGSVGVPASAIQTGSINTNCARIRVGPKGHKHRIQRCTASESLSITSTAAIVGGVIDAATHAGASSIDGPNFSFANPSAGEVAAEHAAITDARNQATAAADQLGYTVTGVQSISLNPQSGGVAAPGTASTPPHKGAPSTPTTVHPGAEEVTATVAVVFTIAPATTAQ